MIAIGRDYRLNGRKTTGWGADMRIAIRAAAVAVLPWATVGLHEAAGQTAFPWSDLQCTDAPIAYDVVTRCQVRSGGGSKTQVKGQPIQYSARGGSANGREAIFWLLWFEDDWVYQPYGANLSDNIIRSQILPSLTSGATNWGPLQSFSNTAFMSFEAKGKKCVGFDHGGPLRKPLNVEGSGYPWLLRGIVCEPRASAHERRDVEEILRAVRLNKGGYVDAFGAKWTGSTAATLGPAAAPPATASAPAAATPAQQHAAPLAVTWEGVTPLASGSMEFSDADRTSGTLSVVLSDTIGRCSGTWRNVSGKFGTADLPFGTWAVSCANGQAASGTYRATTPGGGSGEGRDAQGRKVSIKYGG